MSTNKKLTPLMEQYWSVKNQHPDKVLLFRMGDFFEMFHEDAIIAAPILNIALTRRNKKSNDDTPMCGVPQHSISGPIAKLLSAGHKVAICDQVENPAEAKGLVKRAVTRILSPGMVYDPDTLDQLTANYICSFDEQTVSFLDSSTGENFSYNISSFSEALKLVQILKPVELVLSPLVKRGQGRWPEELHVTTYKATENNWGLDVATLPVTLLHLVDYAVYMQGEGVLNNLQPFEIRQVQTSLQMSSTVLRHLEVFNTYKGEVKGSLFHAVNRTKTSAGARLLKSWLSFPLTNADEINQRLNEVEAWTKDSAKNKAFRKILSQLNDIERRLAKLSGSNAHAKDILSLCESLETGLAATEFYNTKLLDCPEIIVVKSVIHRIRQTIDLEAPANFKSGGIIQKGYLPNLDELITLSVNSKSLLLKMESEEREKLGVPTLKIKYNNVFGYFIEVTKANTDKVPDHYKRKQTLTNAERYITQELQELEDKVLSAQTKRVELEIEIFNEVKADILKAAKDLLKASKLWARWDVTSSLAWLAIEYNYTRPTLSADQHLQLVASRHPVVEQEVSHPFVPNNIEVKEGECMLLTGPNMAGKSTLMRQVAITALLAQIGSFVPAKSATLPVFDKLFTRIGASDFLNEGLSTFMVEMKEAADILKDSTHRSLVVLDEIGRGTSTYDGMSLAQALLEHLVEQKQCLTLFATHYHELTRLEARYNKIKNVHMSISERSGEISFLHTLVEGPANRSYGIHVAQLAGLPVKVTRRAQALLKQHETFAAPQSGQMTLLDLPVEEDEAFNAEYEELIGQIKKVPIQSMTPIEALNKIAQWQQKLS